ncbi:MAG: SWIM zinc finger family protein, partial [Phycisphaerae bacterium]
MAKKKIKITAAAIRRAADGKSYKRGEDYFRRGMVYSLLTDGEAVVAKVRGTRNYKVSLWAEDGEVEGECSCPMGDAGVFCKHLVAAGLTHLAGGAPEMPGGGEAKPRRRRKRPPRPKVTLDDVREHLLQKDPAHLVEIIMRQVEEDDRLRESLLMQVARERPEGLDTATFRAAIDAATETGGFVDYHEAYGFTSGIENAVDSIAELLDAGHAAEVIELTEHALRRCERALGQMDDSDGGMSPILERLHELHHAACVKANPDPEALARRLFKWEIESGWDTFFGAAEMYADVLGAKGLAVYRKLAQKLWDQMPQLGPGDRRSFEGPRFRITSIMEALARASDDIEQLVAVKARDLSSAYRYLDIAQTYKQAKQSDKALEWAEKGLKAFAEKDPDSRLEDFLADEYHRRRRHDDAMALIWAQFCRRMGLESYQHLKQHADRAKQWPQWREKALAAIRTALEERKCESASKPKDPWRVWHKPADHSVLVQIYLWERDVEAAWQEAQAGGCSDALWMKLAGLREKDHPADAVEIYQR